MIWRSICCPGAPVDAPHAGLRIDRPADELRCVAALREAREHAMHRRMGMARRPRDLGLPAHRAQGLPLPIHDRGSVVHDEPSLALHFPSAVDGPCSLVRPPHSFPDKAQDHRRWRVRPRAGRAAPGSLRRDHPAATPTRSPPAIPTISARSPGKSEPEEGIKHGRYWPPVAASADGREEGWIPRPFSDPHRLWSTPTTFAGRIDAEPRPCAHRQA
jgi:hypothetical protein